MRKALALMSVLLLSAAIGNAQHLDIFCENDPPSEILNPDNSLGGFAVDLVREIQHRVKDRSHIEMLPWARGYYAALHNANTLLFSMTRTSERNPLFQWIGPILEVTYGFYVKEDSKIIIRNLDDAKRIGQIGVINDDVREQFLQAKGFSNLEPVIDNQANVIKLMLGRIAAFAGSPMGIENTVSRAGYALKNVRLAYIFLRSQSYIAASLSTDKKLVETWNRTLAAMKADGSYLWILHHYYPEAEMPGPEIHDLK